MGIIIICMPGISDMTNMEPGLYRRVLQTGLAQITIHVALAIHAAIERAVERAVTVAMARLTAVLGASQTVMQQLSVVNLLRLLERQVPLMTAAASTGL
ncbi:hypothetical protein BDW59DRAFT_154907 [Aspergillus cavernicola]|uniref:Uncharacterized protein n=1 Tax=Aspergillus cavernicola TaxID=176166 RepID=A0ABR4HD38_9EURO